MQKVILKRALAEFVKETGDVIGMDVEKIGDFLTPQRLMQVILQKLTGGLPGEMTFARGLLGDVSPAGDVSALEQEQLHQTSCSQILWGCRVTVIKGFEKVMPVRIENSAVVMSLEEAMTTSRLLG